MAQHQNLLIHESSPYLLQHAHNPVAWHAWNDETLTKAKKEDKPLLISIGYSTCHWCHVMEKESFEDEEVARIMNDNFVCIKVDREERPDVDQLYMDAVQLLSGRGGWPLNTFALPDGKPFYGGTYFPKEQWKQLLLKVAEIYANDRDDVEDQARQLTEGVSGSGPLTPEKDGEINEGAVNQFVDMLVRNLDNVNGGIGSAPKFPLPVVYQSLLYAWKITGDKKLLDHVELTLDKMSRGGIYDQLGGGFARYSVDEKWKVPHFEKMLYDNAQLISLYSRAFKTLHKEEYKKVVYETLDFLEREFLGDAGLFYSALDADSEGEEGKFYVWGSGEFHNVLGSYAPMMARYYGIGDAGVWEKGKNILVRAETNNNFARKNNLSETELERLVETSRKKLFERREARTRPATDDKMLTEWNALLISGLVDAYEAFGDDRFLDRALKIAQSIEARMKDNEADAQLYHACNTSIPGFLDDYAFLAEAYFQIYQVTFNDEWLGKSRNLVDYALRNFYDSQSGFFYFTHQEHSNLVARKNDFFDNVTPSGNTVLFNLMYQLFLIYENDEYLEKSTKALRSVVPMMAKSVIAFANWGVLLMRMAYPSYVVAMTGNTSSEYRQILAGNFLPHVALAGSASHNSDIPVLQGRYKAGETWIYVCRERECLLPTSDIQEALAMI